MSDRDQDDVIATAWPLIRDGRLVGLRWDLEASDGTTLGHLEQRSGAHGLDVFDRHGRRLGVTLNAKRAVRMLMDADDAEPCG